MNEVGASVNVADDIAPRITIRKNWPLWGSQFLIAWAALGIFSVLFPVYQWILQLGTAWVPMYLAYALLGGAFCAWRRRWVWCGFAALLAGAAIVLIAPIYAASTNRAAPDEKPNLRILTVNVWDRNTDASRILAFIEKTDPDIVAVQEATPEWNELLRPLETKYPHAYTPPRFKPGMPALALYWRVESGEPSNEFEQGLPILHLPITVDGHAVEFVDMHPRAPFTAERAITHKRMLTEAAPWLNTLKKPRIVAGDFNCGLWSILYRRLIAQTGLVNTRQGFGVLGTWPSWLGPFRTTLDHVLVDEQIHVAHIEVGPHVGSDHRPLLVDLAVR